MKYFLLIIVAGLVPNIVNAQKNDSKENGFGFTLSSSINSEVNAVLLVSSASYYKRKSQLELGVGFDSFILDDQKIITGEFNYKYFPNGTENKFNMYLMMSFVYINQLRKTFYPARYHYFFLNGGYGFQFWTFKGMFIGTNINIGTFTNSKRSENPFNDYYGNGNIFDQFGFSLTGVLNIGYRF